MLMTDCFLRCCRHSRPRRLHGLWHYPYAVLAVVTNCHLRRTRATEPEMLNAIGGLYQDWSFMMRLQLLALLHHEDLAFAQVNEWSRTGWIRALGKHISSLLLLCSLALIVR